MPEKSYTKELGAFLEQHRTKLNNDWTTHVIEILGHKYPGVLISDELHQHADRKISALSSLFKSESDDAIPTISFADRIGAMMSELSSEHLRKGIKPLDTGLYIISLKNIIISNLTNHFEPASTNISNILLLLNSIFDQMTLLTFQANSDAREKIINQQSQSLMELSTPVILLWNNVLLLPLIGVIDTIRARQFTERMLEAITKHEGVVTIIDVTGVPVFDTGVARHIMKAVDAAQLLGSKIVITGISPEGAQTLTKLGISFANVVSRVSLRSGIAEALKMVGRRIELIAKQ